MGPVYAAISRIRRAGLSPEIVYHADAHARAGQLDGPYLPRRSGQNDSLFGPSSEPNDHFLMFRFRRPGLFRHRLSRQLSTVHGVRPHQLSAPADHGALFAQAQNESPGLAFVVRTMQIEFLKPARMDDVLVVETATVEVRGASILLRQRVKRSDETLVEAQVRVACVSGGRARPIPKALRLAMQADRDIQAD